MKKLQQVMYMIMIVPFLLSACSSESTEKKEDIFQYNHSYVGDAGAVGNIMRLLPVPSREQVSGLELETKEEPYGVIVNYSYKETSDNNERNNQELALFNATFLLSLLQNADWVQFNFMEQPIKVTLEELTDLYGTNIREVENEEELTKLIQTHLEDEQSVESFFSN
ncbi:DUF4825 domain-containing protein [Metabacillus sp. HB246100]